MKNQKPIRVTKIEPKTGANTQFHNPNNGKDLSKPQFIKEIEAGKHPDYHVGKTAQGDKYPASNPDGKPSNNLG